MTSGSPAQGEQAQAAEEAKLANPDAVAEREASQTKFEGLNGEQASHVDGEVFPGVIDEPAGGPPKLPAGESVAAYPADNVAQIALPGGEHGVIESMAPIAVQTGPGQRVPIDLGLGEVGGAFEPKTPLVAVRIPKSPGAGVSLPSTGVSLTPVAAQGSPLGGSEGAVDGASVLYANTQTDADTVVKPTTAGFEADTMLRSVDSPEHLFFRVGLPEGASLVQAGDGSGPVEVVDEGATIATILPPEAHDAAGTTVPVSMDVSGDTLTLTVGHHAGGYLYPVEVDPEIRTTDDENLGGATLPTHWKFCTNRSEVCAHTESPFSSSGWGGTTLSDDAIAEYKAGQSAYFLYKAEGDSHVYEAYLQASAPDSGTNIETYAQLAGSGGVEDTVPWKSLVWANICAYADGNNERCERGEAEKHPDEYGAAGNWLHFEQSAYGSGSSFTNTMEKAQVSVAQEGEPEFSFNTSEEKVDGRTNLFAGKGAWLGPHNGAFEIKFHDPGVGISSLEMENLSDSWLVHDRFLEDGECSGVFCAQTHDEVVTYSSSMPNGEESLFAKAQDSVGKEAKPVGPAYETLKVDATPPRKLGLGGLPVSGVVDGGELHLHGIATDGEAPTPSSGIKQMRLGLDGATVLGGKSGSCTPGPCTASAEWTLNTETIGAGKHTLELVAEDNAENIEKSTYTFTVQHAGALSVGPGAVDPLTGALHLSASDVSLSGGRGSLGISRSYNSRQLTAGEQGPLGPQWKLEISGAQEVEQQPSGSVTLIAANGGRTTFEPNGKGGFLAPKGDENLVLEAEKEGEKIKAYLLKDPAAGTTVKYTQLGGAGPWVVASSEGSLSKTTGEKETVEWQRLEGVTRPKLALAPAPAGVTCTPTVTEPKELSDGCRALSFTYATATTATGEAPSQWNAYKGRLEKVSFTAYNPSTKAMETKAVAEYVYDKQGRLRAEWDPRISPALKTTYGYDAEGHVTSVNPPGEEPSLFHYGTTASDTSAGRLLSVTRPPAGTATQVKEQDEKSAPEDTAIPTLSSTSPVIGTTLSVASNGSWNNSPLTYSDAWEDCYTYESKETCTAIPGAVNSSYTPQPRDAGYTLRAQVTAVNADGATVASTGASSALAGVAPAYLRKFGEKGSEQKQFGAPVADAIDHAGDVWVVDHNNDRVEEWSATGTWLHSYGAKGTKELQFESPEGIAINTNTGSLSYGDMYIADKGNNRIEELGPEGKYIRSFGEYGKKPGQLSAPEGVAVVPAGAITSSTSGEVWVGDSGNDRVDEFSEAGEYIGSFGVEGSGEGQFKGPDGIAFSGEDAYVVDSGNDRVQEFSMSGQYVAKFGAKGTGSGQFEAPYGIATEPASGDLYVADSANNRIQELSPTGAFLMAYGKKGEGSGEFSSPDGIAVNATGDVYVTDTGNSRVQELEPKYSTNNPLPEPPALGTSDVTTIDYNVPVSGSGAPHEMSTTELEKWGQKDDPIEATAIFPSDEPMGWPAKDYKRASITYYDELGRTVNHASPSGGIATSEYNEYNEVIRSLSADNRVAALKEGPKSKEVSELLDTKSRYNGETKEEKEKEEASKNSTPGTRLLETRGPQHVIRLAGTTTEKQARNLVQYYYKKHEAGSEVVYLVGETADYAEYESIKTTQGRYITYSYSGQENLGWLLRKPTSVTTEVKGKKLVHTTIYEPSTGNVLETQAPGSEIGPPSYVSKFGSEGKGDGQFEFPHGVAIAQNGNVYVVDTNNDRVQEFSAAGEYVTQWGSEGTGNGQFKHPLGVAAALNGNVYVMDSGNNRVEEFSSTGGYITQWGSEGTGSGQFRTASGLAVASNGDVYVVDEGNDRVEEFSSTGGYITKWGYEGKENGQFKNPKSIAIAPNGNLYVIDAGNFRVEEFSSTGGYITQWTPGGGALEVEGVAVAPNRNVYVTNLGTLSVEEFSSTGTYVTKWGSSGKEDGQFGDPEGIAVSTSSVVYVGDSTDDRVQEFSYPTRNDNEQWGSEGSGNGQFKSPRGVAVAPDGDVYIADTSNDRVQEFSSTGEYISKWGSEGSGNGQFKGPRGVAVAPDGDVYVADTGNDRVQEFSATGEYITKWGSEGSGNGQFKSLRSVAVAANGDVYIADTSNDRVQEFSSTGEYITQWGKEGTGNGQFVVPQGIAVAPSGNVYIVDSENNRVQEFSSSGSYITQWGSKGKANGQFNYPEGIAVAPNGEVYVVDDENDRVQVFSASGEYLAKFGSEGKEKNNMKGPTYVAVAEHGSVYVTDTSNSRVQEWDPGALVTNSQTIDYSAASNAEVPACGLHPEWANLPCQGRPSAQPQSGPELPVVTDTYNIWDEPETITEKFESTTRTKKMTYDGAGRLLTNEEKASPATDTALPKVTDKFNAETGAMVEQSTTSGETTKTIKSVYNTLDQLTEYTDGAANTTQYTYSGPVDDNQVEEVNYGGKKGSQMYSYNATTKQLEKLLDVGPEGAPGAGMFAAGYDLEGKMVSETYPNGMTAKYTYNPAGEATGLEYEKTAHCASTCPEVWFKETVVPSVHGEALLRTSTLAKEEYTYDEIGRLTQVNETPVGKGCKTRIYGYDDESERASETTRESATETCATSGGTTEAHAYDSANRLSDAGVEYEAFGDQTKIPAADAGEHEITASFYVDNQIAVQKQNGETTSYAYDPAGRTEETVSEGTTKAAVIDHYAGSGEAISWASEEEGKKWTRNIPGIDGTLSAVEKSGETPVLQLHDLGGDIVATAAKSETETKLLTTYNSTEFGVQVNGTPPTKYSWLGASGLATEASSAAIASEGSSYVPQLGAPLQTEAVTPPGAYGHGSYNGAVFSPAPSAEALAQSDSYGAGAPVREAEREKAQQEEAEKLAYENECHLASCQAYGPEPGEGGAEEGSLLDPAILLTTRQAEVLAAALRKGPGEVNALQSSGIIGDFTTEMAELIVQVERPSMDGMALGLEQCVGLIHEAGKIEARCKLNITYEEFWNEKKVTVSFATDICYGERHDLARKVFWTFTNECSTV